MALRPSESVIQAVGADVSEDLKAIDVPMPVALGATITRYFDIIDQSLNVPVPLTLVMFIVSAVPNAPETTPIILLFGFARLRTSSDCPAYTNGTSAILLTLKVLEPVPIAYPEADCTSSFQTIPV